MCECPAACGEKIVLTHEEYLALAKVGVVVSPACALADIRPAVSFLNGARVLRTSGAVPGTVFGDDA